MEKEETKITEEKVTQAPIAHVEELVKEKTAWMPKKTFLLIAILVLITTCLLALALIPNFKTVKPIIKPVVNIDYAQTQLSLSAPVIATASGYKTDVLISTGKNKVTVAQLEIAYDPKILTNVDIKAGSFFTDPTILLKKVDVVNGRITYAIGINAGGAPSTGKGIVATISFSNLSQQTTVKTPINFLPKTAVNAAGYAQSVLLKSTGVLFSISPTPTPTAGK